MSKGAGGRNGKTPAACEVCGDTVRIGDQVLERKPGTRLGVPELERFAAFVIDQPTAETVFYLAGAADADADCMLEGDTASSKTASVLYLAMLTNHPVWRTNLSSQTETADLLGKFTPNPQRGISVRQLQRRREWLTKETLGILDEALKEERELDELELCLIARSEGFGPIPETAWLFQTGPLTAALESGAWLLLDEVNVAPAEVIERINPVLERPRYLDLSEGDGRRFGFGGTQVHPAFRAFGTMNPGRYVGRTALSEAFADRWTYWRYVPRATEAEYLATVRALAHGEYPEVVLGDRVYRGCCDGLPLVSPYLALGQVPELAELLELHVIFHAKLSAMSESVDGQAAALGAERGTAYLWTRRELLQLLEHLRRHPGDDPRTAYRNALRAVYLERLWPDDRARIDDVLRALGLHSNGAGRRPAKRSAEELGQLVVGPTWQTLRGQLRAGTTVLARLELREGQRLELTTSPPHGSADFDSVIELQNDAGATVGVDDDGGVGLTSWLRHTVAQSGAYTAVLSGVGRGTAGKYELAWRAEGAAPVTALVPRQEWQTVSGVVQRHRPVEVVFSAEIGQCFDFSTSRSTCGGCDFDTVIELLDADGQVLAKDDDSGDGRSSLISNWECTVAGPLTVRVSGYEAAAGQFSLGYRIRS